MKITLRIYLSLLGYAVSTGLLVSAIIIVLKYGIDGSDMTEIKHYPFFWVMFCLLYHFFISSFDDKMRIKKLKREIIILRWQNGENNSERS